MKVAREVATLLEEAGYKLSRCNKHFVYKNGADTIVVSASPRSDTGNQVSWIRQEIARRQRARKAHAAK